MAGVAALQALRGRALAFTPAASEPSLPSAPSGHGLASHPPGPASLCQHVDTWIHTQLTCPQSPDAGPLGAPGTSASSCAPLQPKSQAGSEGLSGTCWRPLRLQCQDGEGVS